MNKAPVYCLSEAMFAKAAASGQHRHRALPIVSFNHVTREVLDWRISRDFYMKVMGFIEIPRPSFENDGVWLYGFGLNLHLISTRYPKKRLMLRGRRLEHFETALPDCDHVAFVSQDLEEVERQLKMHNVFFKKFISDKMGISQIFLYDPDANMIEISSCMPVLGETSCKVPPPPRPRL